MDRDQLKQAFDQQASSYDQKWSRLAGFRDALHLLLAAVFEPLPRDARILCVGAGTGAELDHLARTFPDSTLVAVEPSARMLDACRRRAEAAGYAARCTFHEGYLDALAAGEPFDAATCLLVSQFILEVPARRRFFGEIAQRLRPGAILASSDLSAEAASQTGDGLLEVWLRTLAGPAAPAEDVEPMRAAYRRDVAILPAHEIEAIIVSGGFESPVRFFQAGLIHAWYSRRAASPADAGLRRRPR